MTALLSRSMTRGLMLAAICFGGVNLSARGNSLENAGKPPAAVLEAQDAICRPTFTVDSQPFSAGTAFVAGGAKPLLLTAQHLFSVHASLARTVEWQDMPARAHAALCIQVTSGQRWTAGPARAIEGAHGVGPQDKTGALNDVAIFPLNADAAHAPRLAFASTPARIGERVWLVAKTANQRADEPLLHSAVVIGREHGALIFTYDEDAIDVNGTSGAPVVDMKGNVVGLNVGRYRTTERPGAIGIADDLPVLMTAATPR
jgi:hypothetical protein